MSDADHVGVPVARVRVFAVRRPKPLADAVVVNVTSKSADPVGRALSPFVVGPVPLYDGRSARNMENAWQFAKVYAEHADAAGQPTAAHDAWAAAGWDRPDAVRFPLGRGRAPLYSLWRDAGGGAVRLGYIEARRRIYAPLYAAAVESTPAFAALRQTYEAAQAAGRPLVLLDHDGWDHVGQRFSLREVLAAPKPKMGHAFVLAGLLEGDRFWEGGEDGAAAAAPAAPAAAAAAASSAAAAPAPAASAGSKRGLPLQAGGGERPDKAPRPSVR